MRHPFDITRFARKEDGSLLVFFLISILAVLGIFALTFDLGRRASTQSDMQGFADNVALAAAGELNGAADAITRATNAAQNVLDAAQEQLKSGTGVSSDDVTLSIAEIVFYTELPDRDRPGTYDPNALGDAANADYKYLLPTTDTTTNGTQARFVGVRLNTSTVNWLFARAVTDTTTNPLSPEIGAIAIAGNAGYTCEIAPLMVCLPTESDGVTMQTLATGRGVQLRTVGRNAGWNPGEFGFLNIDQLIEANPEAAATCASYSPESRRQACLLALGTEACFNTRGVDIQPGQRSGQETAGFNLPFGIFEQAMGTLRNDDGFEVGPHIVSGRDVNNNCNDSGPINDGGPINEDTMAFPLDDCHSAVGGCTDNRFGDGNWSAGRANYVATNYTIYDPVDPVNNPPIRDGSWFDFPETLTRYEFYQREIERAANGGDMSSRYTAAQDTDGDGVNKFAADNDGQGEAVTAHASWDDFWPDTLPADGFNPIIPDAHGRDENGLPQCNQVEQGGGIDRRVVTIAGIDCVNQTLTGNEPDVPVVQYYRTFMLSPATEAPGSDPSLGQMFDLHVEIIEPVGGEGGGSTTVNTAFREVVQLYR